MIDINVVNVVTILIIAIFGTALVKWGLNAAGLAPSWI